MQMKHLFRMSAATLAIVFSGCSSPVVPTHVTETRDFARAQYFASIDREITGSGSFVGRRLLITDMSTDTDVLDARFVAIDDFNENQVYGIHYDNTTMHDLGVQLIDKERARRASLGESTADLDTVDPAAYLINQIQSGENILVFLSAAGLVYEGHRDVSYRQDDSGKPYYPDDESAGELVTRRTDFLTVKRNAGWYLTSPVINTFAVPTVATHIEPENAAGVRADRYEQDTEIAATLMNQTATTQSGLLASYTTANAGSSNGMITTNRRRAPAKALPFTEVDIKDATSIRRKTVAAQFGASANEQSLVAARDAFADLQRELGIKRLEQFRNPEAIIATEKAKAQLAADQAATAFEDLFVASTDPAKPNILADLADASGVERDDLLTQRRDAAVMAYDKAVQDYQVLTSDANREALAVAKATRDTYEAAMKVMDNRNAAAARVGKYDTLLALFLRVQEAEKDDSAGRTYDKLLRQN